MDKSNVATEESPSRPDCPASASKSSLVSLVHIDSISIHMSCPMEEITEEPQHEHFSIRGFVAGVRKKDLKMSSPFPSEADYDSLENDLPSLSVPKFRWWRCSHCVPKINTETTTRETEAVNRTDTAGKSSYSDVSRHKSRIFLLKSHDTGDAPDKMCQPENPCVRTQGTENGSSGSEGGGEFIALPERKKLKLRSLADIMEEEKNSASGNPRTTSASSNGTHNWFMTIEADAQLHAGSEDRKGAQIPRRKKRSRRENIEVVSPTGAAKRLKGHVPEAEKKSKRAEVSDSLEAAASARFVSQVRSRTKRIKNKKNKILQNPGRKRLVNNDSIPNSSVSNAPGSENLGKDLSASESGERETATLFNGNPELLNGKITDDSNHARSMGHCSVQKQVALDLSLNSFSDAERSILNERSATEKTGIPDLNESIMETASALQDSETRCLAGDNALGASGSHRLENDVELGGASASDDIPMEIVELLAKNQQERVLEDSRQRFPPAVYMDHGSRMISFHAGAVADTSTGLTRGFINLPHGKYFQLETSDQGAGQLRLFTPLAPIEHRNSTFPMSEPIVPETGTSERVSDILFSSGSKTLPFTQQPNGFFFHSFPDENGKRKSVCDKDSINIPAMQLLSLTNPKENEDPRFIRSSVFAPLLSGTSFPGRSFNVCYFQGNSEQRLSLNDPSLRVCVLNRNPEDFTIMDENNEFTISAKDLKFRKRNALKQRDVPKRKWTRRNPKKAEAAADLLHHVQQHKSKNTKLI